MPDAEGEAEPTTVVGRVLEGDTDANAFDNLESHPGSGSMYVIEDHGNGGVWACQPDGAGRNL